MKSVIIKEAEFPVRVETEDPSVDDYIRSSGSGKGGGKGGKDRQSKKAFEDKKIDLLKAEEGT